MVRQKIVKLIEKATGEKNVHLERPENPAHGDYSTNIALKLKKNPADIIKKLKSPIFEKVETAGPGFINFFISKRHLQKKVEEILRQGDKFGQIKIGKNQKVNIEFISANPTGPLHIGNARGGYCGDTLSNVLEKAGHKVFREYYVNDMGRQIEILNNSLRGKQPAYAGPHIEDLKKRKIKDVRKAIKIILAEYIKPTVEKMGIKYDKWFYESDLYKKKEIDKVMDFLKKKGLIFEKEDAVWFKSRQFGDDKDRVLVRKNDKETYFLSDIAYLKNKFQREFRYLVIFLGAEHYGYIPRLKAATQALGFDKESVKPIIMQLVKLIEKGREVRMSKRTGIYVTIDELLEEVGNDVSRFFFLQRGYGSHLLFDLDLAKEQSEKNPVYYVQYAHARICSILRKIKTESEDMEATAKNLELLNHLSELNLMKQLVRLPEIVEDTAEDYQVQRIPQYALDLAGAFHQFYRDCKVISKDENLTQARLGLISATKTVLKNTLNLMGISAPERM